MTAEARIQKPEARTQLHGNDIGHGGGGGLPPNILWVMTDQLRRDCVGAYGSRGGRTPHLDSLAEDGVVFDRFYSTCPLCIPARSSLHTGRYPHSCGSLINGFGPVQDKSASVLNEGEVTVDEVLAEGGYHLGHVGVDHVRTEPPERRRGGFAEFISRKEHGAYLEERGLEQPSMWDHQKACPTRIADEVHEIRFSAPNPGRHPFEAEDYFDCYCAREGARFIREAPEDRPFALFLFLWMPHPPFVIPEPYYSMYSPGDVDPPPTLMAEQTGKPPMHLEHLPGQVGADPTREEWLESWAAYLGCVALADDCVGTALGALEETGRSDDTLMRAPLRAFDMEGDFDIATPWNFACFKVKGGALAYYHGGMSPQELIIPVMVLTPTAGMAAAGVRSEVEWGLTPGSKKLTTRFFSVQVNGTNKALFELTPPKVRIELRAKGKPISRAVSASYGFDESTGDIALRIDAENQNAVDPNTVALMITEESEQKTVSLHLLDATNGSELSRIDKIEVAIGL